MEFLFLNFWWGQSPSTQKSYPLLCKWKMPRKNHLWPIKKISCGIDVLISHNITAISQQYYITFSKKSNNTNWRIKFTTCSQSWYNSNPIFRGKKSSSSIKVLKRIEIKCNFLFLLFAIKYRVGVYTAQTTHHKFDQPIHIIEFLTEICTFFKKFLDFCVNVCGQQITSNIITINDTRRLWRRTDETWQNLTSLF